MKLPQRCSENPLFLLELKMHFGIQFGGGQSKGPATRTQRTRKVADGITRFVTAFVLTLTLIGLSTPSTAATTATRIATGMSNPNSGLVLSGSTINPTTGVPYRHLWVPDHLAGICRMDPDLDSGAQTYTMNSSTCLNVIPGGILKPGQLAYDPGSRNLYTVDLSAKSQGIYRLHFLPEGDSGHGAIDTFNVEVLGGLNANCGTLGKIPNSANLGPDGNLYVGFKQSGNIVRLAKPGVDPVQCGQVIGVTANQPKNFGLGWIGHDLYGADGVSPWLIRKADQCFTAANGNIACQAVPIFAGQVPAPSSMISDQVYPALNGTTLYMGMPGAVAKAVVTTPQSIDPTWATGLSFVSGLAIDASNPGNPVLYAADDTTEGAGVSTGRLWSITTPAPAAAAPGTPGAVSGKAGDASVTLNWTPGANGSQPTTSYTITATPQSGGLPSTTTVNAVPPATTAPTSATITSLTNNTGYIFTVAATNSVGTSPASAPTVVLTPMKSTAPAAPTDVSAIGGNGAASVAWSPSASDGGSPIRNYRVTTIGVPAPSPVFVGADVTGVVIAPLTNNKSYTFTVEAINNAGLVSAASAQSNRVTPTGVSGAPDVAVTMTSSALVSFGSDVTYQITVTNNGPAPAAQVILTDTLPASGASFKSATSSKGACTAPFGLPVTCNLGALNAGTSATVTIVLNATGKTTNSVKVQANNAQGQLLTDPNPANNTASVTTDIAVPLTTTDLQVNGSAKAGAPAVNSSNPYTWTIRNRGKDVANGVIFTNNLPSTLTFSSASTNLGSCSVPAVNSRGGDVTCTVNNMAAGQTMTVTVNVLVPTAGSIATTGSVTFSGTDTNPKTNSDTVTIKAK
jgi:uncharacterized repeat protein (TIGR01451 family)